MSKFLSLVLRHRPDLVGISLDRAGWVSVPELLAALALHGRRMTREDLGRLVAESDKQRFALDAASDRIRANQGHSVSVDLGLTAVQPPGTLYHGTPKRNVPAILEQGLRRGRRHHVHLSPDLGTAARVGSRRGPAAVLAVAAGEMAAGGYPFYLSENGVWLVDAVPAEFLSVVRGAGLIR